MLDFVDDVAAGGECFAAMSRTHADPDGEVADVERAGAMHARGAAHTEARHRFRNDPFTLADGQRLERLVFEAHDTLALVVVPYPALERDVATAGGIRERRAQRGRIERGRCEPEHRQPPATGGMKTTVSPFLSGVDQSPNSPLMATLSCSCASAKR